MNKVMWEEKPYYSLNYYFKSVYGEKVYKIALDGGMTCPNRDGIIDTRGCIFCSSGGSGDFAIPMDKQNPNIAEQIRLGKEKLKNKSIGTKFVAYFQSYTNTYGPTAYLRKIYRDALLDDAILGISIATRPDCLSGNVLNLFEELLNEFPDKFIWVELGLQTIHPATVQYIRRGYDTCVFEEAVMKLHNLQIPVIVHVILGLPGETKEQMLSTIEYLNTFPIFGIKLQLLHVLKNTDLATDFSERKFDVLSTEEYIDIVISCLEQLNPEIVIHRVTGDGPKNLLIAPTWSSNKKLVLNTLLKTMASQGTWQGKHFSSTSFSTL